MQIRKISTPPKICIKMIKIPLIGLLVAPGADVECNVPFLLEALSSIVTGKDALLSKINYLWILHIFPKFE